MEFNNICNIDINDSKLWKDKLFCTFDIDCCIDEVLSYSLSIIKIYRSISNLISYT